jgi:hypothetical protein
MPIRRKKTSSKAGNRARSGTGGNQASIKKNAADTRTTALKPQADGSLKRLPNESTKLTGEFRSITAASKRKRAATNRKK